jgi:hypothetical protein
MREVIGLVAEDELKNRFGLRRGSSQSPFFSISEGIGGAVFSFA